MTSASPPIIVLAYLIPDVGDYWVVNQILAKQLHTTDPGILKYTTHLMDKLEQVYARNTKPHIEWSLTSN